MTEIQNHNTSAELKKQQLRQKRQEQDEKYKIYYEQFEQRYQLLLKQVLVNDHGQEVYIPHFLEMEAIYPLIPTRINKQLEPKYEEIRQAFESDLLQQEHEYHEIKDRYEDALVYHDQFYEFIGDHLLPNFKQITFQELENVPKLASGRDWKQAIKIDLQDSDIQPEVLGVYPEICKIEEVNSKFNLSRWPFIEGPNTQESAFMHYLLSIEKIRPLQVYFKNDFYLEFKEWPSRTELSKRAMILAKLYCKNHLSSEQAKISAELAEMRRIQREKQDHDQMYLKNLNQLDEPKKEEDLPTPPSLPINVDPSLSPIVVYNPELILRIQDIYKQIHDWLEEKAYDAYQKGKFKEALDYKKKREDVERDMVVITNPEQLLRILLLFKITNKI